MNCEQCQELLVAAAEGLIEPAARGMMDEHLAACPICRAAAAENDLLRRALEQRSQSLGKSGAGQRVMDRILREQSIQIRRLSMQKRIRFASIGLAAAAVVVLAFGLSGLWSQKAASASDVMAAAATAASKLDSVHVQLKVRTLPRDNFELIGLNYDFVTVDMWKQFVPEVKWHIEKSGRVVVMDGNETILLIKGTPPTVSKAGPNSGAVVFLKPLMDVDKLLDNEIAMAQKHGYDLKLTHEQGKDGTEKLVVTLEIKANVSPDDWCRNKAIQDSDTRRVYTFDGKTKFLEGLQIYVKTAGADVLVLDITKVEYNPQLVPTLFALDVPKDAIWYTQPQPLPDNEKYAKMTPEEAARAFFEACGKEDWNEVLKYQSVSALPKGTKDYLGGLEIISVGKAFKSPAYPAAYFVPYEIRLKNGETKKFNLAVRNDNPAHRYIVDGGF